MRKLSLTVLLTGRPLVMVGAIAPNALGLLVIFPTGLTRHLIQGRALRTNYPLSELSSSDILEAKNARLQEWLKQRLASKEIRFYGESTYLFDE